MIRITVVTLFPDMFKGPMDTSIIGRAAKNGLLDIGYVNIRDFAPDRYKTVDDRPYGGGHGMIMRVDIVDQALAKAKRRHSTIPTVILMDPRGVRFTSETAKTLALKSDLVILCGHYEGIDERIRSLVDLEISVGDFVVTGGELPAMLVVDAVARMVPGVLHAAAGATEESFSIGEAGLLEFPQYTRPSEYNGMTVPDILLSGNHAQISAWREEQSLKLTRKHRPDLLKKPRQTARG
jgi:tRNA (guanine37-N1)-methyltransferase